MGQFSIIVRNLGFYDIFIYASRRSPLSKLDNDNLPSNEQAYERFWSFLHELTVASEKTPSFCRRMIAHE